MELINKVCSKKYQGHKEKVLQIGEGNFLRCFADWMIDLANESGDYEGKVVLCQPISQGLSEIINGQDGMYTTVLQGLEGDKPVQIFREIHSISRCINPYEDYAALLEVARSDDLEVIISNTTDAGIAYVESDRLEDEPPSSYPAKLCAILYRRYQHFQGNRAKGLLILPVELIDNNGVELKRIVLQYANQWKLEEDFILWLSEANEFTSTLVDRIVTGYPRDTITQLEEKLGYQDNVLVTGELFHLWVIEGDKKWADKLPIHKTGANVIWTEDVTPYKKRKVRILNASHTAIIPAAYLAGHDTVLDFFENSIFGEIERTLIYDEIIPTLNYDRSEMMEFADAVIKRFSNPYIKHRLQDILLNNCAKFSGRCIPIVQDYYAKEGKIPRLFAFCLATFIRLYKVEQRDGAYVGVRDDEREYTLNEAPDVLDFFANQWKTQDVRAIVHNTLSHPEFWSGVDLCQIAGLDELVFRDIESILQEGVKTTAEKVFV